MSIKPGLRKGNLRVKTMSECRKSSEKEDELLKALIEHRDKTPKCYNIHSNIAMVEPCGKDRIKFSVGTTNVNNSLQIAHWIIENYGNE